jgi:ABC-type polysaccharide/polyol phosphate export permease
VTGSHTQYSLILLCLQLFAKALSDGSGSIVNNQNFITKIYFSEVVFASGFHFGRVVDFFALSILFRMMWYCKIQFTLRILPLPILTICALIASISVSIKSMKCWWLAILPSKRRVLEGWKK